LKTIIKLAGIFYFATLFYIFFLARRRRGPRLPWHQRPVNLIPLRHKIEYIASYGYSTGPEKGGFYIDLFGNIILFIPFAFFLMFLFNIISLRKIVLISLLTSISVEVAQFIFSVGVADIDDVILNTLGGILGLIFLNVCKRFFLRHPLN
jgi:glycopeptide antibiotics resistance protein